MNDPQANRLALAWIDQALSLAQENAELRKFTKPVSDQAAVRDIYRAAAVLALSSGGSPQAILWQIASEAPDEKEWAKLVAQSWDGLPSSVQAHMNGLASEEAA